MRSLLVSLLVILLIIYIIQIVIACIAEILLIAEDIIEKEEWGTEIYLFVLLINITPAVGYITAPALCMDCINNIKKHKQRNKTTSIPMGRKSEED